MLNLAVCDDDIPITGKIEMLLQKIGKEKIIDIETEVFWDGQELAEMVEKGNRFDIIFLDIEMKKEDGISAARRVRKYDKNALIIFVTSHENYMSSSFAVRPFRFLLKPIKEKDFISSFLEACEEISNGDYYFRYRHNRINYKILIRDILYFESQRRKINIVTIGGITDMYGKLNEIEKSLRSCKITFLRIHQSYLVNYKHISEQAYEYVTMSNNKQISISEDRRKMIREAYCMIEDTFHVE